MKTKFLLVVCFFVLSVNMFSAGNKTLNVTVAASKNEVPLSDKILKELEVIRIHAVRTDSLRKEAKKKYEQKNALRLTQDAKPETSIISAEYEVLSEIEEHTKEDYLKDGWNVYGIATFIISVFAFGVSCITYSAQKKVEKQTKNASLDVQCGVLNDLYRHLYRNLLCTCAILYKYRGINGQKSSKEYPSEANLQKLTTLPEDIILPIDVKNDDIYRQMHEMKKLLKNYNMEINVASEHFSCKEIEDKYLKNDYDNLMFKPLFLVNETFRLWDEFKKYNRKLNVHKHEYAIYMFVREHFSKLDFTKIGNGDTLGYLKETNIKFNERTSYKSLFDCLMSIAGVEDNGIQRSLGKFCESLSGDSAYIGAGLKIKKKEFNDYLKCQNSDNVEQLLDKKLKKVEIHDDYNVLLKSYKELFSKDEWMLDELLFHILRIDIALEIPKVGMVNYH